jgi:CHAT domain-containing protein/Tfp pilus assembly protein PilF
MTIKCEVCVLKRYWLSLLLVLCCISVTAQHSIVKDTLYAKANQLKDQQKWSEAASLYEKLLQDRKIDSLDTSFALVPLYSSLGECLYMSKRDTTYKEAVFYIEKAIQISKQNKDTASWMTNELVIGRKCLLKKQYVESRQHFQQATSLASQKNDTANMALSIFQYSRLLEAEEKFDEAKARLLNVVDLFSRVKDSIGIMKAVHNLGILFYDSDNYRAAADVFFKYKQCVPQHPDASLIPYVRNYYRIWLLSFISLNEYDKAKEQALTAIAIFKNNPDINAIFYSDLGDIEFAQGNYQQAIDAFVISNHTYGTPNDDNRGVILSNQEGIANCFSHLYKSDNELEARKTLANYLNDADNSVLKRKNYYYMAELYYWSEKHDSAMYLLKNAIELSHIDNDTSLLIKSKVLEGDIYYAWSEFNKTESSYMQGFYLDSLVSVKEIGALKHFKLALLYSSQNKLDLALAHYLDYLAKGDLDKSDSCGVLNNIGLIYDDKKQYNRAIEYYQQCSMLCDNDPQMLMVVNNNIGYCYFSMKKFDEAEEYYKRVIELGKVNQIPVSKSLLISYGYLCLHKNNAEMAIPFLKKYIEVEEKLRLTAPGSVKRDCMAAAYQGYEFLISAYYLKNNTDSAFLMAEKASARYMLEELNKRHHFSSSPDNYKPKPDQCVVRFTNSDSFQMYKFVIDENGKTLKFAMADSLAKDLDFTLNAHIEESQLTMRGAKQLNDPAKNITLQLPESNDQLISFLVHRYRQLLAGKPSVSGTHEAELISRQLYLYLFGDITTSIKSKKELLIIPEGELSMLPFETLITPEGKYLGELFNIRYLPSLSIGMVLQARHYPGHKKDFLAVGGANYELHSWGADSIDYTNKGYTTLDILNALDTTNVDNSCMTNFYEMLRINNWNNLPGTQNEINAISALFKHSKASQLTGDAANEFNIKKLSDSGKLAEYKIIHFATHGLVVPQLPDLSAIILTPETNGANEGYLRAPEIEKLNIRADFVNLSACETGLGKMYKGEGVVGLTKSFLIAGANGVSVSLWKIDDMATMKFMVNVYQLVVKQKLGYCEAIHQTRIQFMKGDFGDDYKHPYYWAPFVYYGL